MGKVNVNDVDKYGGSNGGFFQLKEHMEKAKVRFMLEEIEDLNDFTYAVHNVKVGKDDKYGTDVNCLREYDDPVDACPFCQAGMKQTIKVFVPIYNIDEGTAQVWTRGRTIIGKLSGLMTRYKDFPSHIFEIERHGKKGDQKTNYEIYEDDDDDITLDDLPDVPDIEGMAVQNKSEDDMNYYLDEGEFPPEDDDDDDEPVRSRSTSSKKAKRNRHEDDDEDVRPRRKKVSRHEEDEDDEEDEPVRKKSSKSKKSKRHRDEDEF